MSTVIIKTKFPKLLTDPTVPVLADASSFALSDTFGWKQRLFKKFEQAKAFYLVIGASTVSFGDKHHILDPIKALEYTAAINGITAIPILFVIMRIANEKKIRGKRVYNKLSNVLRWITVGSMTSAAVIMFVSFNRSTL
jgi:Mn2+/Fe2+ NRAMP family transporter